MDTVEVTEDDLDTVLDLLLEDTSATLSSTVSIGTLILVLGSLNLCLRACIGRTLSQRHRQSPCRNAVVLKETTDVPITKRPQPGPFPRSGPFFAAHRRS